MGTVVYRDATVFDVTSAAFSLPAPNLSPSGLAKHVAGDRAFEAKFVSAPAVVNPGLGPIYNNNSCLACHKGDGGGRAPEDGGSSNTLLFRLSVPGVAADGGPVGVPGFGGQLQDQAVFGVKPEARMVTTYAAVTGDLFHTLSREPSPLKGQLPAVTQTASSGDFDKAA